MEDRIWKAGIYARLSNFDGGADDKNSIANQVEFIKDKMEKYSDVIFAKAYTDKGYTGTNFDRPGFADLISDMHNGIIDCIVVKDLSRFGRNYLETGYYLEKVFANMKVRFISINDNYDSLNSRAGENIIVPLKSILNDMYSKDLSKKVKASLRTKELKGVYLAKAPYGYTKNNDAKLIVDEPVRAHLLMIFELFLKGYTYSQIAKELDKVSAPIPVIRREQLGLVNAKPHNRISWNGAEVKNILVNPVYTGDLVFNRIQYDGGTNTGKENPLHEWRIIKNAHEGFITHQDSEKAREIIFKLDSLSRDKADTSKNKNPLDNRVFCSTCGRKIKLEGNIKCSFCAKETDSFLTKSQLNAIVFEKIEDQIGLIIQSNLNCMDINKANIIKSKIDHMKQLYHDIVELSVKSVTVTQEYDEMTVDFANLV